MKNIIGIIEEAVVEAVDHLYGVKLATSSVVVTPTKREHKGDYTLVTFAIAKQTGNPPPVVAKALGEFLQAKYDWISEIEVIQGFLNIGLSSSYWRDVLSSFSTDKDFWRPQFPSQKVLVEYSSPNTNKPLHLGHIRNILLGWSMYKILSAGGHDVMRVQIINDRGIAICKSMLAWKKYGEGATPQSTQTKSDHFVGDWYVRFEKEFSAEYKNWQSTSEAAEFFSKRKDQDQSESDFFKAYKNQYFNTASSLGKEARDMLLQWEDHDPDTIALWKKMNNWVYEGFDVTYRDLGVSFDKLYYESNTYLLGKDLIEKGLKDDVFYKKDDGSVWVDLTDAGLDHKLLLRSDGTSVYMTQDIGTAQQRFEETGAQKMIYVVADEQNYHFQALFAILKKLGVPFADGLYHLNYGMVELPEGRMKSREGTVVDADDLMAEVIGEATEAAKERDNSDEATIRKIALAALKFFLLKVDPRKKMIFDPKASVDLQGQTGPYVQNAYVRIQSILRKAEGVAIGEIGNYTLLEDEKLLLNLLQQSKGVVENAGNEYNPSLIAQYIYNLAKEYHRYYHDVKVLQAESEEARSFRLLLIKQIAHVLQTLAELIGIEMPERM